MKIPALLTSTSIDLKRDSAVSTILAAVAGSPMCPSTSATWLEAATSADWVIFRELATTLKPRSTNLFTIPAPIPCDAPVTMAVFHGSLMIVYLHLVAAGHNRSGKKAAPIMVDFFGDLSPSYWMHCPKVIAEPASTTGNDQAQSPRNKTAAAPATQPAIKPKMSFNVFFSRSLASCISG